MPKQISLSNCSVVLKYSNSRYLERFVICCSFMKSLGGSQNHTICISPLVHGLSFQLQAAVIVLSFIERHIEGFHGEASQARTRLSDLVDSYGIPVGFVCSVLGEAAKKQAQKEMLKEIHRRAPSFSSLMCLYLFVVQHSLFDQHFKCSFWRAKFLDFSEIKHL